MMSSQKDFKIRNSTKRFRDITVLRRNKISRFRDITVLRGNKISLWT